MPLKIAAIETPGGKRNLNINITVDFTKLLPKYSKFRSKVRKFVAKFKVHIENQTGFLNKAFDWIISIHGPIGALFTNWLLNFNMNF